MSHKHSLSTTALLVAALAIAGAQRTQAVELLVSGDFETPGGIIGDVPGWMLDEFATGSATPVNSAEVTGGADAQIFLRAFEGGGPLHPSQGNFDDDSLPAGNVDGRDFLTWQRGNGITTGALPSQGDAEGNPAGGGDGDVDQGDLTIWKNNFGKKPLKTNARLSQTVPAAAGETYSFQGTSTFEDHYSGFVTNLEAESPFGTIQSPTTTTFKMEFLDAGGQPIGAPVTRDLRTEQTFPGFPVIHAPLTAQAPTGTVNVRVTAEALDMVWNGAAPDGPAQSAFFNDFSLTTGTNPGTDLLTNGNLDQGIPDALDFWNQVEDPATQLEILRTPIDDFSDHTHLIPGKTGSRGVWLSAFFGAIRCLSPLPWTAPFRRRWRRSPAECTPFRVGPSSKATTPAASIPLPPAAEAHLPA